MGRRGSTDLVEFVEENRELEFKRPVKVDFLEPAAFRKEVTQERGDLTEEEQEELAALEGLARAVGLIGADFDLLEAGNDLAGEGILAFYEPETKKVTVKGPTTSPSGSRPPSSMSSPTPSRTSTSTSAGWASWRPTGRTRPSRPSSRVTPPGSRTCGWASCRRGTGRLRGRDQPGHRGRRGGLAEIPEWIRTLFGAPYALGLPFVEAVFSDGGSKALDRVFKKPPASEEQVVNPGRYLANDAPKKVPAPKPGEGQKKVDQADFGVLGWVVVLAERLTSREVMRAIDGWGGDAYLTYTEDGRTCVDVHVVGDDETETEEFGEVFTSWAEGIDGASVDRAGEAVVLRSCEPDKGAPAPERPAVRVGAEKILTRLATRSTLFAGALDQGASPTGRRVLRRGLHGGPHRRGPGRHRGDPGAGSGGHAGGPGLFHAMRW